MTATLKMQLTGTASLPPTHLTSTLSPTFSFTFDGITLPALKLTGLNLAANFRSSKYIDLSNASMISACASRSKHSSVLRYSSLAAARICCTCAGEAASNRGSGRTPVADAGVVGLLVVAAVVPGLVGVDLFGVEVVEEEEDRPEMPPKSWSQPDMLLPNAGLPLVEGVRLTPGAAVADEVDAPAGRPAPVGVDAPPGPGFSALMLPGRKADACGLSLVAALPDGLIDLLTAASIDARILASADMALPPPPPAPVLDAAELDAAPPAFLLLVAALDADEAAGARPPAFLAPSVAEDLPFRDDLAPLLGPSSS